LPGPAVGPAPQGGRADRPGSRDGRPHPPGVPGHRPVEPRSSPRHPPTGPGRGTRRVAGRPARDGRGGGRDEWPQVGRPHAWGAAAVPRVRRQDRQRDRDRPPGGGEGHLPGPAGCRPVPAEVVGRGSTAGRRHRLAHRTVRASFWRATTAAVWVAGREHPPVVAIDEATAEVTYFLTNATGAALSRLLAVAFRRWVVEHSFRFGQQEAGL